MKTMQRQRGMTGVGWMLVFALIVFFTFVGIKIMPIYMDSFTVGSVLSDLEKEAGIGSKTPAQIMSTIMKRLDINMIEEVGRDNISIDRSGTFLNVEIDYEVRRNFMGNIDVVLSFTKKAEIPIR